MRFEGWIDSSFLDGCAFRKEEAERERETEINKAEKQKRKKVSFNVRPFHDQESLLLKLTIPDFVMSLQRDPRLLIKEPSIKHLLQNLRSHRLC